MNALGLYGRYIGISLRGQMQYRASFVMHVVGLFLITLVEFVGLWALFRRFGSIRSWKLPEVALCYGMVCTAFGLAEIFSRGFDTFAGMIRAGSFDRLLLRPRTTAGQVFGQQLELARVGRMAQGLAVLIWALAAANVQWTAAKAALVPLSILSGACVFVGLHVVQATMCFWTVQTLEIMASLTNGGNYAARVPLTIYREWFRKLFTYVVPLAVVNYFPLMVIVERDGTAKWMRWAAWAGPVIGAAFLVAALRVWRFGVRHYRSTGS